MVEQVIGIILIVILCLGVISLFSWVLYQLFLEEGFYFTLSVPVEMFKTLKANFVTFISENKTLNKFAKYFVAVLLYILSFISCLFLTVVYILSVLIGLLIFPIILLAQLIFVKKEYRFISKYRKAKEQRINQERMYKQFYKNL